MYVYIYIHIYIYNYIYVCAHTYYNISYYPCGSMWIVLHLDNPVSDSSFLPRLGGALRQYLPPPWHPMAPVDGWMTSYGWMVDGWMMLNDVGMN